MPATATVRPVRNGAPSTTPRHIMMPPQRGGGSPGCSWARTPEYSPSAPTSTSPRSVEAVPLDRSRTRTSTPDGDSVNPVNAVPVRTAPGPSRARTAASRIICSSPR